MDIHKVRSNYRVCDNHFAPEYKIGDEYFSQSGLITGAVPTLNRSSNLKSDNTAPAVAGEENAVVIATVQPQYDPEAITGPSHENNERMDFQQSEIFVPSVATENIKSNVGSRRVNRKFENSAIRHDCAYSDIRGWSRTNLLFPLITVEWSIYLNILSMELFLNPEYFRSTCCVLPKKVICIKQKKRTRVLLFLL
ncbi:hypothetical protein RN001_001805 [Aquatica leii]|uniref:Uncharacterized protein n=1 Tax=Aquatica leii TaxID=1421715 RepID=A0AAN7PGC7_9COLE|nr:hypothetical protein RN001_001805 [Aquatica leii]